MKINSLESIWDNLGYIANNNYSCKKHKFNKNKIVYNCQPLRMKDGTIKNTFIEVGYLYLFSRVKDDSQGFIYFDCIDRINYDNEHKIQFDKCNELLLDKLVGHHNINIAQIYNEQTKEYLNKESNIKWNIRKGQAIFTTKEEAEDYIKQCENSEVELLNFF